MSEQDILVATGITVSFSVGSSLGARLRHQQHLLHAVDGVDLTVRRGEALALVGESGSGKSTLARAIAGIQRPNRGQIKLDGKALPARRRSRADQRRIQIVFQDPYSSLNPRLTVGGILHELLRVHHVVPRSEVESYTRQLLRMVGLPEDAVHALPRQFSGGQRQRVGGGRGGGRRSCSWRMSRSPPST
jgi:ABC-type dipeptide/oligopeptide/nickel transport system ATPase subunit